VYTWLQAERKLKTGNTVDCVTKIIIKLQHHWKNISAHTVASILCSAEHNLAFCGSSNILYATHNGDFLGLIAFIANFDQILKGHISHTSFPSETWKEVTFVCRVQLKMRYSTVLESNTGVIY